MRTETIHILALILLLSFVGGCNPQSSSERDQPLSIIAVIGDSIGNGYRLATPWPTLLKEELSITLFNTSISGKKTDWGLDVIEGILDTHKPSHLLISLGTNDAAFGPSIEITVSNLQKMVNIADNKGIAVIVGTVIPNLRSSEADQRAQQINEGIFQLRNATIVDVRAKMDDPKGLLADGVHPNQDGQHVIANAFLEQLLIFRKAEEG